MARDKIDFLLPRHVAIIAENDRIEPSAVSCGAVGRTYFNRLNDSDIERNALCSKRKKRHSCSARLAQLDRASSVTLLATMMDQHHQEGVTGMTARMH